MGCFDSTCAVTRLPIHHGDEIVYVEYRNIFQYSGNGRSMDCSTYDFLHYTSAAYKLPEYEISSARVSEEHQKLRHPEKAMLIDGFADQRIKEMQEYARNKVIIVHGKYNDYGGIGERYEGEEVFPPDDIRMENLYFFVHKAVWDGFKGENDYHTLYNINVAAMDARVELFSTHRPLGQQYSQSEFIEARRKILDIAENLLPTLYVSGYGDDEEDEQLTDQANITTLE